MACGALMHRFMISITVFQQPTTPSIVPYSDTSTVSPLASTEATGWKTSTGRRVTASRTLSSLCTGAVTPAERKK